MLVLSRKIGQKIMIGHNIELTVLDVRGDTARIGIEAPKSVTIHRKEVYEEIRQSNHQAMAPPAGLPGLDGLANAPSWLGLQQANAAWQNVQQGQPTQPQAAPGETEKPAVGNPPALMTGEPGTEGPA